MIVKQCVSCGASIVWLVTPAERRMPVNVETVREGDVLFESARHVSHFATCPNAATHRRPRR